MSTTTISENIKQAILIVFSVVLGLYLSERIEESKNKRNADQLLAKIIAEVKDNRQLMKKWTPYHIQIANALDTLSTDQTFINAFIEDKTTLYRKVLTQGTFMGRMPSDDAWDIAKSHPLIVNLDYDKLLILSKIYSQQKSTFQPTEKISSLFFSPDINAKDKAAYNLQVFNSSMQEIVSREIQLLEYMKEAESVLNFKSE